MLAALWTVLAVVLVAATLPGTLELLLLTLAALLPARREHRAASPVPVDRLAVIVPAHDEEATIAACLDSLRHCRRGAGEVAVVVVADNCRDRTAERARALGAEVLERRDPGRPGKGHALAHAFAALGPRGFDAFLVVDADSRVEPDLIRACGRALRAGADAVQCRVAYPADGASPYGRLLALSFWSNGLIRPRGRDRLGLSCGLLGSGFALRRETLAAVPFDAASIAEDLEYHLRLVLRGRRVRFVEDTTVRLQAPPTLAAARSQRSRWEGGRLRMVTERGPVLLRGVLAGRWRLAEPLLDLLLLPLGFHCLLLLVLLASPLDWSRLYALVGLGVVLLHLLVAVRAGKGSWRDLAALLLVPWYLAWKLTLLGAILAGSRADAPWVRTPRWAPGGDGAPGRPDDR